MKSSEYLSRLVPSHTEVITSGHPSDNRDLSHTLMSGKIELLTD